MYKNLVNNRINCVHATGAGFLPSTDMISKKDCMYLVGSIHWVLQQRLLTGALLFASKSSHVHHSKLIDASESLHHLTTFYIVLMYIHILMRILFILYALYIFVHNIHIYVYIYIILCLYIYIHKMHINLMTRILIVNPSHRPRRPETHPESIGKVQV